MPKGKKTGVSPQNLTVLDVLKDLKNVEPLQEDVVQTYLNEDLTTEVVNEEENEESVEEAKELMPESENFQQQTGEPVKPAATEDGLKVTTEEQDAFTTWLDEVKQRQKVKRENRSFIYLDEDVVNTFITVKEATGIAANHLIGCILSDWINAHKDNLTKVFRERKKKKILIEI